MNAHLAHDISHLASGGSGLRVQRITISARVHVGGNWSAGANGGRASLLSMLLSSIWVVSALAALSLFWLFLSSPPACVSFGSIHGRIVYVLCER